MLPDEKKMRYQEPCAICGLDPEDCRCVPSALDLEDDDFNDEVWEDII